MNQSRDALSSERLFEALVMQGGLDDSAMDTQIALFQFLLPLLGVSVTYIPLNISCKVDVCTAKRSRVGLRVCDAWGIVLSIKTRGERL